jgi:hypothetical protein
VDPEETQTIALDGRMLWIIEVLNPSSVSFYPDMYRGNRELAHLVATNVNNCAVEGDNAVNASGSSSSSNCC